LVSRARAAGVGACVSCGCSPEDWPVLETLSREGGELGFPIHSQFGLHPWEVKDAAPGWEAALRDVLQRHPEAGIGEIGLDNHFEGLADFQSQMTACELQMRLAEELSRPVTLHCVKAQAETALMIKRVRFTGNIVLHAFSGSKEQVKQFLSVSDKIYFSVGSRMVKSNVLAAIPLERILAETDSPDQVGDPSPDLCPPQLRDDLGRSLNDPSQLPATVARIAAAHGISFKQAATATRQNTITAFSLTSYFSFRKCPALLGT